MFCGWLSDRLCQRDSRWQLGLPALGALISLPAGIAVFQWPTNAFWTLGSMQIPHAMLFVLIFAFFASWWPTLSYSAVSQMVSPSERGVGAALLNLFVTLLGVGLGPMVTGALSDYFAGTHGADGLRWALTSVVSLMVFTVLFFILALGPYHRRLSEMKLAAA